MKTLLLRFGIELREHDIPSAFITTNGPMFHRWLPDGENDAIALNTGNRDVELKVWFERFGFKREMDGFIVFDHNRREVDPDTMAKQAVLDAGPLMGSVRILGLSREVLTPIVKNKTGDARYIALGKRIVGLIYKRVARFLEILRTNYGQYWIRELEKWDSHQYTLGAYCHVFFDLRWSLDGGHTWAPFVPDEPAVSIRVTVGSARDFLQYLSKDDWQQLAKVNQEDYEPSLATHLLAQAHRSLDQGDLKHALIEGVSALEVALEEFGHRKFCVDQYLDDQVKAFWNLPLRAQLIPLVTTLGKTRLDSVKLAAEAVEMRNKVVHDGWTPPESARHKVCALLHTISTLLPRTGFRFPSVNPGNKLMSLEEWEKLAEEDEHGG